MEGGEGMYPKIVVLQPCLYICTYKLLYYNPAFIYVFINCCTGEINICMRYQSVELRK